ncbi:hypothetical protein Tco_1203489 [Tanacetum coccineum]
MKGEFMIRNKARLVAQGYTQEKGLTMMKSLALKFGFKKSSLCSTPRKLKSPLLKDEDGEEVDVIKAKKSVKLMMEKLFRMELELMLVKTINEEAQLHALVDGKKKTSSRISC